MQIEKCPKKSSLFLEKSGMDHRPNFSFLLYIPFKFLYFLCTVTTFIYKFFFHKYLPVNIYLQIYTNYSSFIYKLILDNTLVYIAPKKVFSY